VDRSWENTVLRAFKWNIVILYSVLVFIERKKKKTNTIGFKNNVARCCFPSKNK